MRILVTRSKEENLLLKSQINEIISRNIEVIALSLISYENIDYDFKTLQLYENIIITSKYAVKLLSQYFSNYPEQLIWAQKLKFLVVGQTSSLILNAKGLNIIYVASNVTDLITNLSAIDYKKSIYLSGNFITHELDSSIVRNIIYLTHYKTKLTENEILSLQNNIDYILIYSLKTAEILIQLFEKYQLLNLLQTARIITLSKKIVKFLSKYINNISYDENIIFELKRKINEQDETKKES